MNFQKTLKRCQLERHMTNDTFAKFLGKSRAWLQGIYTTNPSIRKFLLGEQTMFDINEKLDIPIELMEQYNADMLARYKEQSKQEDGSDI